MKELSSLPKQVDQTILLLCIPTLDIQHCVNGRRDWEDVFCGSSLRKDKRVALSLNTLIIFPQIKEVNLF